MATVGDILSRIYYDPSHEAAFASEVKLYKAGKREIPWLTREDVKKFLRDSITYTLHFPRRHRFPRNPIIVNHLHEQHQADIADISEPRFSQKNDGYRYLLAVIDCLSKQARVEPLKTKTAVEVTGAFKKIYENWQYPLKLQTDRGREFQNEILHNFLKEKNVHHFTSQNQTIKCAIVERFIRTFKMRLFKYVTSTGTERYLEDLQNIVNAYNNTHHRTIKMAPNEVTVTNEREVFLITHNYRSERDMRMGAKRRTNISIGDNVRIKHAKESFIRGFLPNYQDMVFTVVSRHNVAGSEPLFKIKNYDNRVLLPRMYAYELEKISPDPKYRISRVLRTRTRQGLNESQVNFVGYPENYTEWIPSDSVGGIR